MNSQNPPRKRWKIPPLALRITVIVILVAVIIALIVCFKHRRDNSENVSDLFGDRFDIKELSQMAEAYVQSDKDDFRTYNPCMFSIEGNMCKEAELYWAYRFCNFALCPGKKCLWDDQFPERIKSHTLIENPSGDLFMVTHPTVSGKKCPQGCQDARTFVCHDRLYLVCNDTSGENCRREMYIMELDTKQFRSNGDEKGGGHLRIDSQVGFEHQKKRNRMREIVPLAMNRLNAGIDNDRDQKNWMPLIMNDQIYFVYSINPHVIFRYHPGATRSKFPSHKFDNDEIVNCEKIAETSNPKLPDNLRGGGQIARVRKWKKSFDPKLKRGREVKYAAEDLYLGVIHTRESQHEYSTYFYAFEVIYPFRVKYITRGFVFGEAGSHSKRIQFASGLAQVSRPNPNLGRDENYLYVTYGENDCTSKLCILKEEDVLRALHSV